VSEAELDVIEAFLAEALRAVLCDDPPPAKVPADSVIIDLEARRGGATVAPSRRLRKAG
jgi:hypothetical protein